MIMRPNQFQKNLYGLADKIKLMRSQKGLTQTQLGKHMGLTRASVNGWEMGVAIPSAQFIAELARVFGVSSDFLLGIDGSKTLNVDGLTDQEIAALVHIIDCFRKRGGPEEEISQ